MADSRASDEHGLPRQPSARRYRISVALFVAMAVAAVVAAVVLRQWYWIVVGLPLVALGMARVVPEARIRR